MARIHLCVVLSVHHWASCLSCTFQPWKWSEQHNRNIVSRDSDFPNLTFNNYWIEAKINAASDPECKFVRQNRKKDGAMWNPDSISLSQPINLIYYCWTLEIIFPFLLAFFFPPKSLRVVIFFGGRTGTRNRFLAMLLLCSREAK